jgi:hypothetical protein
VSKIQVHINIWPGKYKEGQKIIDDLMTDGYKDIVAIVSGEEQEIHAPKVIYLNDEAYFGEQFRESLKMFEGDILLQIQSDALIMNSKELINSCKNAYESGLNIGIWAPDINYTSWITEISSKKWLLNKYDKRIKKLYGLVEVINTDCTCWALSKEVIEELNTLDLKDSKYGWGLDLIASAICRSQKIKVMRNINLIVKHPKSTGYNEEKASLEWVQLKKNLPRLIRKNININKITLIRNKVLYLYFINIKRIITLIKIAIISGNRGR